MSGNFTSNYEEGKNEQLKYSLILYLGGGLLIVFEIILILSVLKWLKQKRMREMTNNIAEYSSSKPFIITHL
jgi:hypothetical protein